eukprot:TRINITY_DN6052_c0_g1_i1.p1 TRINITY_DN6052_c0_g1~~TRINITY_DN6052_c0_g1_i1.p1  ORF type:complete len:1003 (-),score=145.79 TRINITY_DN6052_c0_g1_i1:38-3046(-)
MSAVDCRFVRNFCLLAHVDHGKTTLCDFLIASNGIISQPLAGKVHFMDSLEDEQAKRITMKASSIGLRHQVDGQPYFMNLVDSPGHIDFSSEVSAAVRVCDGGLVLIDAVDGVSIQTHIVLQQAYQEKMHVCLVLNKIDRLITELDYTPQEAYLRLSQLLQSANVIMASLLNASHIAKMGGETQPEEELADNWFDPAKGNVIFASALHGWAFTTFDWAKIISKKLGWSEKALRQALWGQFYIDPKEKRISKTPVKAEQPCMFVQCILQPLWDAYKAVVANDEERKQKIVQSQGLEVKAKDLKSTDPEVGIRALMGAWLPLHRAVLDTVVRELPSPAAGQGPRLPLLLPDLVDKDNEYHRQVAQGVASCDATAETTMAFVAKMLAVDGLPGMMGLPAKRGTASEVSQYFIGFCRVFSGTLKRGQKVFVLGPRYQPSRPELYCDEVVINDLYLLQGRGLEPVDEVPAGHICGIPGLEKFIVKSATITTDKRCPVFNQLVLQAAPIVRFALYPEDPADMKRLEYGLVLLNRSDPLVESFLAETGEHIICCAGEVHAERCINDLTLRLARVPIHVSEPLVGFKETIAALPADKPEPPVIVGFTPNKQCRVTVRCLPMPANIQTFLEGRESNLKYLFQEDRSVSRSEEDIKKGQDILEGLHQEFVAAGPIWEREWERLWCIGPKRCGPNLLLNHTDCLSSAWRPLHLRLFKPPGSSTDGVQPPSPRSDVGSEASGLSGNSGEPGDDAAWREHTFLHLFESVIAGFQLATNAGPMCEEPMCGVVFCVENVDFYRTLAAAQAVYVEDALQRARAKGITGEEDIQREKQLAIEQVTATYGRGAGPLSGQVMACIRDACRQAFSQYPRRLVEAIYECAVVVSGDCSGKVYSVLNRRRADIIEEVWQEGSDIHTIRAHIPCCESFGFAEELRGKTSGRASPQMRFSHWRVIPQDPFWVPTTQEEVEDFGVDGDAAPNVPKLLINKVRKRKGLMVDEKVVAKAEKMKYSVRGA